MYLVVLNIDEFSEMQSRPNVTLSCRRLVNVRYASCDFLTKSYKADVASCSEPKWRNFMAPKRRFLKDEQKMKPAFSIDFSLVRRQNRVLKPVKWTSKSGVHLLFILPNLRLGTINFSPDLTKNVRILDYVRAFRSDGTLNHNQSKTDECPPNIFKMKVYCTDLMSRFGNELWTDHG